MNICIVTVYNTDNCGSFWQAVALGDVLKKMGHSVSFLYRNLGDTSQSFKGSLRIYAAKCFKFDFNSAFFLAKKARAFRKAQKCFDVIERNSVEFNNIDLFVIGSDTVWNFASPYFFRHRDKYTGAMLGVDKCITYAASAANTSCEKFENREIAEPITHLKAISVRDEETYNIVKKITGRESKIVCDPTMLAEREVFDKKAVEITDEKYILLYHFEKISNEARKEILSLKEAYGLKVISFGEYRSWCDKTVCYDPYSFVSYFKNAAFVVTDTFHGTIFSIINEKKFAELGNKKKKISDLLKSLQLTNAIRENDRSIVDIYEKGLDYTYANEKIKQLRKESMDYLKENLSEN